MDGWSARRRDLYLTTDNAHMIYISTQQARFELAILASERPQNHVLNCAISKIWGVLNTDDFSQADSPVINKWWSHLERSNKRAFWS